MFKTIAYGSTTIADSGRLENAAPDRIEGRQIVETIEGAVATALGRGSRTKRLPLSIPHYFDTNKLASAFVLDHYDSLNDADTLTFTIGISGDTATRTADAVLESCVLTFVNPTTVVADYVFLFGAVVTPP